MRKLTNKDIARIVKEWLKGKPITKIAGNNADGSPDNQEGSGKLVKHGGKACSYESKASSNFGEVERKSRKVRLKLL